MRFLFACGGTAGHINPALAVAGMLRDMLPGSQFIFVGSGREMENRLIPAEGYELKNIKITGFARGVKPRDIKHNLATLKNLSISGRESRDIIENFKPDIVIGTGGYVCYPVLKAAAKRGIPTVMHESNAVPGLTTKLLSGVVNKMLVAFPEVSSYYKKPENVVVTGTPVRGGFFDMSREEARKKLGITGKPLVVSFWGSLGADGMNHKMADFIRLNSKSGAMRHIHATGNGEAGVSRMIERLSECGVYGLPDWVDLRPYIDNMGTVMAAADIVLCRAGASTIAEITGLGRASVLVPSPNVTNNHQEKNARQLEKAGGAVVLTEDSCSGELLYNTVIGLLRDKERLSMLEKNSARLGQPDACKKIVDVILSLVN
ncbi:MAG: UDP-N-acetylglucosamine--N-acetylmuramyl-(pentapeptide) pyrophosphoryl-undecaprenol N-acetylglucosamine transferase [Oscillospiraceae bacterium]